MNLRTTNRASCTPTEGVGFLAAHPCLFAMSNALIVPQGTEVVTRVSMSMIFERNFQARRVTAGQKTTGLYLEQQNLRSARESCFPGNELVIDPAKGHASRSFSESAEAPKNGGVIGMAEKQQARAAVCSGPRHLRELC